MFLLDAEKKVLKNFGDVFLMPKFAANIKECEGSDVETSGFFYFLRFK